MSVGRGYKHTPVVVGGGHCGVGAQDVVVLFMDLAYCLGYFIVIHSKGSCDGEGREERLHVVV